MDILLRSKKKDCPIEPSKCLLIQGRHKPGCIEKIISTYKYSFDEIIISSYRNSYIESFEKVDGVKVVYTPNDCGSAYNHQNIYFHALTCLTGAVESKCDYILKIRADEHYSNLDRCYFSQDKMITCNAFMSPNIKFHIGDHVIGMRRDIFINTFKTIVNDCIHHRVNGGIAESVICLAYLNSIGANCDRSWKDIINTNLEVVYVEDLAPFYISYNSARTSFQSPNEYYSSWHIKDQHWRGVMSKGVNITI